MIVEDLKKMIYSCSGPEQNYKMMCNEDENFLLKYLGLKREVLFETDKPNLIKLSGIFNHVHKQLINFNTLPMFYEMSFYINFALGNFDLANKYLRSFAACIEKFKSTNPNIKEVLNNLEEVFNYGKKMLKEHSSYNEKGIKDTLVKFFASEDYTILQREINIRILMRTFSVSRNTALGYLNNAI